VPDLLLKGLTDDELAAVDAAVTRDGSASRSAWIRETLLARALRTGDATEAVAVITRELREAGRL